MTKIIQKKGFTLVELIVVITILAILGTIAFISLNGYSRSARDSRRISDIGNIKTSLELFTINTGKYPLPDNLQTATYSGATLWMQGVVGDNVSINLSRNLQKKPTDPTLETEYVYSVINSQTQYELLANYEGDEYVQKNNLLNATYAVSYTPKVSGNYNGVFIKTSDYIFPVPSIITAEDLSLGLDFKINPERISSQIITGGTNNLANGTIETSTGGLTGFNLTVAGVVNSNSSDAEKIAVIDAIQSTYSGTILVNDQIIANVMSKTTDDDKITLVEQIVLNTGTVAGTTGNSGGTCVFGTSTFGNCQF